MVRNEGFEQPASQAGFRKPLPVWFIMKTGDVEGLWRNEQQATGDGIITAGILRKIGICIAELVMERTSHQTHFLSRCYVRNPILKTIAKRFLERGGRCLYGFYLIHPALTMTQPSVLLQYASNHDRSALNPHFRWCMLRRLQGPLRIHRSDNHISLLHSYFSVHLNM